jgi:hypothetical protein
MIERLAQVDWLTVLLAAAVIIGVLLTPYDLLRVVQRRWEQRRQQRIARGEDVTPRRVPYDDDEEDEE